MSRGMSRDSCGLRKSLAPLSDDGWSWVPTYCLFDLRCPSSETYRLLGGVRSLHQGPKRSTSSYRSCTSPYVCHQLLCPQREPQSRPVVQETFLRPTGRSSGPGVYRVSAFALSSGAHTSLCVPPGMESLLSPVLWSPSSQVPLAFKSQMLWGLLPLAHTEEQCGARALTPVGELP